MAGLKQSYKIVSKDISGEIRSICVGKFDEDDLIDEAVRLRNEYGSQKIYAIRTAWHGGSDFGAREMEL